MPYRLTINGREVQALRDALSRLSNLDGLKAGLLEAAAYLKSEFNVYPPQSSRPQPFVSDKQRRGFFARLNAGEIQVPYRRRGAGGLGGSWSIATEDAGLKVTIGTNISYGPLVMGAQQTQYHQVTGWKRADVVAMESESEMVDIIGAAIEDTL